MNIIILAILCLVVIAAVVEIIFGVMHIIECYIENGFDDGSDFDDE